jgi:integrase
MLAALKLYFRFLHHQCHRENLEQLVPAIRRRQNANVPALWSEDELQQLLTSIDRGNPTGKRDYAILLLAVQLGVRVSDIAALKLSDLSFDRKTIGFTQQKTEKTVVYPMLDDVGWAIIDWLRYGRPKIENPYVFLTCTGTPMEFSDGTALGRILRRRMQLSGIRKEAKNTTSGMHSLRHALARRLVENDTGLYDVVSIMGHRNSNATSKYTRTDINGLRECALAIGV